MVQPDETVWKEIDVSLLAPSKPAAAGQADVVAAGPDLETAPARGTPSPSATADDPEERSTESVSVGPSSREHQGEASVPLEKVVPVHIGPDPDRDRPELPRTRRSGLGWWGLIAAKSALRAWIAVLAAVWLLLLAALLFRGLGETLFPAEALERSNDIAAAGPSPDSFLDAALELREGVAARDARADVGGPAPGAGRMSESAPGAVVAEPEAVGGDAVSGGTPAVSGGCSFG